MAPGINGKMNELQAAVGLGNIKIFHKILEKRRENLLHLIEGFKAFEEFFTFIKEEENEKIGPHAFSIILKEELPFTKEEFTNYFLHNGIDSRNLFYSMPTQTDHDVLMESYVQWFRQFCCSNLCYILDENFFHCL